MSRRVIKEIEALRIGPEERLLIRIPEAAIVDDRMLDDFQDALAEIGIGDRVLVVVGDAEFAIIPAD